MEKSISRRQLLRWGMLGGASVTLAACAPKVVEVTREVEKVVEQTVVVEKEKQVEVTKVVEKEKVVTAMPAPAQKHDMVMYVGWGGLWGKLNEELVAMFIEKNPTYTIEVLTGHDWDKLTVAIAGGNPPDVSHAYWGWGRLIATQGGWTNLTPRVDLGGPCAKENFDQVAWDMTSRNGEPYCIPYLVVGTFPA